MRSMNFLKASVFAVLAITATAAPASAHHSFAMFDYTKSTDLKATVKQFEWTNPHAVIWVTTISDDGSMKDWAIECLSPGSLTRRGWTKRTLNPGDKVSVKFYPLKDGRPGGAFGLVTLADGTVMRQDTVGSVDRGDK